MQEEYVYSFSSARFAPTVVLFVLDSSCAMHVALLSVEVTCSLSRNADWCVRDPCMCLQLVCKPQLGHVELFAR